MWKRFVIGPARQQMWIIRPSYRALCYGVLSDVCFCCVCYETLLLEYVYFGVIGPLGVVLYKTLYTDHMNYSVIGHYKYF